MLTKFFNVCFRCFAQLTSSILVGKGVDTKNPKLLSQHLPDFHWLLRDVSLELPENEGGSTMTPTEFLRKEVLNENATGEEVHTLLHLFPNLKGSMLSPPHKNPQKNPEKNSEFFHEISTEIQGIFRNIHPKKGFCGTVINGPLLVGLIHEYIKALNQPGTLPNLEVSWLNATEQHLKNVYENLVKEYVTDMEECTCGKLPLEEKPLQHDEVSPDSTTLYGLHAQIMNKCLQSLGHEMKRLLLPAGSLELAGSEVRETQRRIQNDFVQRLAVYSKSQTLCGGELFAFVERNRTESMKYCRQVFEGKYSSMDSCVNIKRLREEYLKEAIGPAKEDVYGDEKKNIPGPPSDATVLSEKSDSKSIILCWNQPSVHPESVKDYDIEVKEGQLWTSVTWKRCHVRNFHMSAQVADLKPNTEYRFQIRGKSSTRSGEYCDSITSRTEPGCPEVPPKLDFDQLSSNEAIITIHPLKQGEDNGSEVKSILLQSGFAHNAKTTEWKDEEVAVTSKVFPLKHKIPLLSYKEGGEYLFQVKFRNIAGFSKPSDTTKVKTCELYSSEPIITETFCGVTSLDFKWKPPVLHPQSVQHYEVKVRKKGTSNWKTEKTSKSETSYKMNNLKANTEYEYQIQAQNKYMEGDACTGFLSTIAGCPSRPEKPSLRVISPEKLEVSIQKLTTVQENGVPVTHVNVEKSHDGKVWDSSSLFEISCDKHEVELYSKESNNTIITYLYYCVRMKNEKGWSDPSEYAQLQESDLIPSAPRDLQIIKEKCGPRVITLKWEKPLLHASTVKVYLVQIQWDGNGKHFECMSSPYEIENVRPNTVYKINVQSLNGRRDGMHSKAIEYTTPYARPNALQPSQINVDVMSATNAKLCVEIPELQEGEKPVTHVIVENLKNEHDWEQASEIQVNQCGGTLKTFNTKVSEHMRILLKSEVGTSEPSAPLNVPSSSFVPGEPINLCKKNTTSTSVTLCWKKPQVNAQTVKNYLIEQRKESEGFWKSLYSVYKMEIVVDKLHPCSLYKFRVCAAGAQRNGDFCEPVHVVTKPAKPFPPKIAMVSCTEAELEFTKLDFNNYTKIRVETYGDAKQWKECSEFEPEDAKEGSLTYVRNVPLSDDTPLEWRVQLIYKQIHSEFSDVAKIKPGQFIPGTPTELEAENITKNSLTLSWKAPDKNPKSVASYEIVCSGNGRKLLYTCKEDENKDKGTQVYTYTITDLIVSTEYEFSVCAINAENKKGEAEVVKRKTVCPKLGCPYRLKVAGAAQVKVKVRWSPPQKDADVVGEYEVSCQRNNNEKRKETDLFQKKYPCTKRSSVIDGLKAGTKYTIEVCAISKDGTEGEKAKLSVKTKHGTAAKVFVGGLTGVPTLGAGAVATHFAWKDDEDVEESD